ncbi:HSP20-like chaperone [Gilbertella persicaria]|uniref:HSP20-like chaperone n=1 Tax=Gilbertella persicaria TaxID=101096 RepID=UPI00221EB124|nr:HSP20-like chaperone [Gilbertella persicaria]KAI8047682.1 HSP20-like chaperone [Gilbertella persicaria]
MALTHRLFSDALRDMQQAMAVFDQPFFSPIFNKEISSNFGRLNSQANNYVSYPATDIVENPESYELHAEIPGYNKKDIKIEVNDGRTLVLSGSTKKEKDADNEQHVIQKTTEDESQVVQHSPKWWVNERVAGSFSRSFSFPHQIDTEQIKASYENGVLKIVIPKNTKSQSRLVDID